MHSEEEEYELRNEAVLRFPPRAVPELRHRSWNGIRSLFSRNGRLDGLHREVLER